MSGLPRVGIDAHHLAALEGNRTYAVALLRALARAGTAERFRVLAYGPHGAREPARLAGLDEEEARAFSWGRPLPRGAVRRTAIAVPLAQRRDRLAMWHASFVAPPLSTSRIVLAVHDALALVRPELFSPLFALRMRVLLPRSIARATRVLVPTEQVRADLEGLGLGRGKVDVAPIGVDGRVFRPEPQVADVAARQALGVEGQPYVLAVGRADRRKRLPLLVRSFARIARAGERLVLAGPIEPTTAALLEREGKGSLVIARSPDERTLAALYRGARALAFPSAGEGLGLPVVEALASGTPVVASDLAVLREVARGAALALVPEASLERDLGDVLRRALDLSAGERQRVARAGLESARRFSLAAMAYATERAWRAALA